MNSDHWKWLGDVLGLYAVDKISADTIRHIGGIRLLAFPEGADIIREGEANADLYVVYEGQARVNRDGKEVAEFIRGHFFGELGFLVEMPRTATVSAGKDCQVFRIPAKPFEEFVRKHPGFLESCRNAAKRRLAKTSK